MSLKVYNTLSGQKEEFVPLHPAKVRMYVCGVTVYDYCHIGHARSAMVFDVMRNYFQSKGYEVLFVKNLTDVDDKTINAAKKKGVSLDYYTNYYIKAFFEDRIHVAEIHGIKREQIILDPGQGAFISGDPKYSLQILKRLKEFEEFNLPILIGSSRKSLIGMTLNLPLHERLEGSLACAAVAVMNGAKIIRAHDIRATRRIIDMVWAIIKA